MDNKIYLCLVCLLKIKKNNILRHLNDNIRTLNFKSRFHKKKYINIIIYNLIKNVFTNFTYFIIKQPNYTNINDTVYYINLFWLYGNICLLKLWLKKIVYEHVHKRKCFNSYLIFFSYSHKYFKRVKNYDIERL